MALPPDMQAQQDQEEREAQQTRVRSFIQKRFEEDFAAILASPAGRRVLHQLQRELNFYGNIQAGQSADFNLGVRRASVWLRERIERIDPTLPARMELEWLKFDEPASPSP